MTLSLLRIATIAAAFLFVGMTDAPAQSYSTYDWQTGNSYYVTPRLGGGAHVQGQNLQTGSMWSTDIDQRGNMTGRDAGGNTWTYDQGSGTYLNFGTGRMCVGQGLGRICN